jgi:ribulose-5-phosphate 4-epimerase/fuculose-1-phosphate aldolase
MPEFAEFFKGGLMSGSVRDAVTQEEWRLRVDLAACYRLLALHGWDDLIFTHISARVPGAEHHFLINPYGWGFEEMTASALVKVDLHCKPVLPTPHPVNPAGFTIHSAIHEAREDVVCIVHTHTPAGVAVSAQKAGLLPISQQATVALASLAYHDYEGLALHEDERPRLTRDLGTSSSMILRNHGLLTVGTSVAEAFLFMFNLERACQAQIGAQAGSGTLVEVDPRIVAGVKQNLVVLLKGMGAHIAWPAMLRRLDRSNPGYDA